MGCDLPFDNCVQRTQAQEILTFLRTEYFCTALEGCWVFFCFAFARSNTTVWVSKTNFGVRARKRVDFSSFVFFGSFTAVN